MRSRSALPASPMSAELLPNITVAASATPVAGASRPSFGPGRDDLGSASGGVVSAGSVVGSCTSEPIDRTFWAESADAPRPRTASARLQATRDLLIDHCLSGSLLQKQYPMAGRAST